MVAKLPDAFLSYTRSDDSNDGGAISEFRRRLADAVRAVTGEPFEVFQDVDGIGLGEHWPSKLDQLLDEARFFIPILTPSYFRSPACRDELGKFLRAEEARRRSDLVLPIYYIECHVLEDAEARAADPLAESIHERQRQDWRKLRYDPFETKEVRKALDELARGVERARLRATSPGPPWSIGSMIRSWRRPSPKLGTSSSRSLDNVLPPRPSQSDVSTPGRMFRDVNEPWCPKMAVIPAGRFRMGTPSGEPGREECEGPVHEVAIAAPFALGHDAVTRREFAEFAKESGLFLGGGIARWGGRRWSLDVEADWRSPGLKRAQNDRHPVVGVSWEDAHGYCTWLSLRTRQTYRLPTEAEWEYAARAGTTNAFWMGATITTDLANYDGRFDWRGRFTGATVSVDDPAPINRFGLRHVHGNVWEWCEDHWHGSYEGAPLDGSAWMTNPDGESRIVRGGSWYSKRQYLRSGSRRHFEPATRYEIVGFRVASSLAP